MIKLILLCLLVVFCNGNQLDKLISFVKGGANPAGSSTIPPPPSSLAPRANQVEINTAPRAQFQIVAPIPFSEVADPNRGVVDIDVPQPKNTGASNLSNAPRFQAAAPRFNPAPGPPQQPRRIVALPAGATQVGGTPYVGQERDRSISSEQYTEQYVDQYTEQVQTTTKPRQRVLQVGERDQNTLGLINQQYQGTRQPQVSRGVFSLPGADQHRQYTEELKLAQDALLALG